MKHIILGGDGFVGRFLAKDLLAMNQEVVVGDIKRSAHSHYESGVTFVNADVTQPDSLARLAIGPDDVVYNMAARMLVPIIPRRERKSFFWPVNNDGVDNLLAVMDKSGARRMVQFTTDMVYGHTVDQTVMTREDHPKSPLGEYGASKLGAETVCQRWRERGMSITIGRPRLIIGPGRLGILVKLFKLIDKSLPVPMIGSGQNPYQFISVYDCSRVCISAWKAGFPNGEYNLGSTNPPKVVDLLGRLIKEAGSRSILIPTPAPLVKAVLAGLDYINLPLMDPEQYLIADETCIRDTAAAKRDLDWQPKDRDDDMLNAAYREYRAMAR
jgi:dTDP-glucose 4,6-dehydratase